jgi:hypothetical protein
MTKYKTTDREQRLNNSIVLGFSYCNIQNIERFLNPNAYTCGVYGWRADFYEIDDGVTISTGYAPLNYISKTDFDDVNAYRQTKAAVLRAGLIKIEKRIAAGGYKWQKSGSWHDCRENLRKVLSRLIKKANEAANEAAKKHRI